MVRILVGVLMVSAAGAQTFDVASVRASQGGRGEGEPAGEYSGVAGELEHAERQPQIRDPLGVSRDGLSGLWAGLAGLRSVRYCGQGRGAGSGGPDADDAPGAAGGAVQRLTLQRKTKELPAYLWWSRRAESNLHESQITEGEPVLNADKGSMTLELKEVTATQFVEMLSNIRMLR